MLMCNEWLRGKVHELDAEHHREGEEYRDVVRRSVLQLWNDLRIWKAPHTHIDTRLLTELLERRANSTYGNYAFAQNQHHKQPMSLCHVFHVQR